MSASTAAPDVRGCHWRLSVSSKFRRILSLAVCVSTNVRICYSILLLLRSLPNAPLDAAADVPIKNPSSFTTRFIPGLVVNSSQHLPASRSAICLLEPHHNLPSACLSRGREIMKTASRKSLPVGGEDVANKCLLMPGVDRREKKKCLRLEIPVSTTASPAPVCRTDV